MATKKILFATDYSPASLHALQFAAWLANSLGSPLLIVHVSEFEQYPVGELFNEPPDPDFQELARLRSVRPEDPTIDVEHRLLYGENTPWYGLFASGMKSAAHDPPADGPHVRSCRVVGMAALGAASSQIICCHDAAVIRGGDNGYSSTQVAAGRNSTSAPRRGP